MILNKNVRHGQVVPENVHDPLCPFDAPLPLYGIKDRHNTERQSDALTFYPPSSPLKCFAETNVHVISDMLLGGNRVATH